MILETLQLQNFGRFSNAKFDFKPCTVFWGKNESGKTTILDALFLALLDKQINSSIVQMLNNRYGSCYRVSINPSILEKSLSLAELENFYVVRSSKIQIDFSGSANTGIIKSKLLETALNVESLIEEITRDTGSRAKNSYGYRISECNATAKNLENEIKNAENILNSYTENALAYKNNQISIKRISNELSSIKQNIETIEERLASLKEQENTLSNVLLQEKAQAWLERAEQYIEKKHKYERDYGDVDLLHVEDILNTEASLREVIEKKKEENQKKEDKIKNYKYIIPKIKSLSVFASISIIAGLLGFGLLVLGAILKAIIGIIAGFICLAIAGVLILINYFKRNSYIAEMQRIFENDSIKNLKDVQKQATLLEEEIRHSGLSEHLEKLEAVQKQKEELLRKLNLPHEQALRKFCSEKTAISFELKTLYQTAIETVPIKDFNAAGIPITYSSSSTNNDDENLLLIMQAVKRAVKMLPQIQNSATGMSAQLSSIKKEITELERIKKDLADKQTKVNQQKDTLGQKQTELIKLLAGFDQVTAAHDKAVSELKKVQEQLDKLNKENEALAIVLDILQAIAHTMKQELSFIEEDLQNYFADIVPAFRNIAVSDVDPEKIKMPDIKNEVRPVNLLSQGTQDIFYLGFRMLLGSYLWEEGVTADSLPKSALGNRVKQKKRQNPGFFLWDEPFTALDTDRLKLAVAMLKKFQEITNFQHVIFTKDETVVKAITAQWKPDALIVHNL